MQPQGTSAHKYTLLENQSSTIPDTTTNGKRVKNHQMLFMLHNRHLINLCRYCHGRTEIGQCRYSCTLCKTTRTVQLHFDIAKKRSKRAKRRADLGVPLTYEYK